MTKTETIKHIKEEILPKNRRGKGYYNMTSNPVSMWARGDVDGYNKCLHEVHSTLPSVYDYIEERVREEVRKKVSAKMEDWASIEHDRWAKWQRYMHSKIEPSADDSIYFIGKVWLDRWNKQIDTPYELLSEEEKESDREQVRPYIKDFLSLLQSKDN
jgi:hypothetical protein